jgi:hypothetical protein
MRKLLTLQPFCTPGTFRCMSALRVRFHDITEGSNSTPDTVCGCLCTAEPGYDGPTGLGTPNGIGGF